MKVVLEAQHALVNTTVSGTYARNVIKNLLLNKMNDYTLTIYDLGGEAHNKVQLCNSLTISNVQYKECKEKHYLVASRFDDAFLDKSYDELMDTNAEIYHFMSLFGIPARLKKGKMLVSIHSLEEHHLQDYDYADQSVVAYDVAVRRLNKLQPDVIVDSIFLKNQLYEMGYSINNKVSVVNYGYDANTLYPDINTSFLDSIGATNGYLLCFGSLKARKNLNRTLQSFEKILQHYSDLKIVFCGNPGNHIESFIKELFHSKYFNNFILMRNVTEETRRLLYSNATALVCPSLYDGNACVALEAMACGCPIIASDIGAFPEIISDAGLLVNPADVDSIYDAIERTLNNTLLRSNMSKKGLEAVKGKEWEAVSKRIEEIYMSMVK